MEEEKLFTKKDLINFAKICMIQLSEKIEEGNVEAVNEVESLTLTKIQKILRVYKK